MRIDLSDYPNISTAFRRWGYADGDILLGLLYAAEQGEDNDDEAAASLAMARILYSDDQLADGATFTVSDLDW
jgi:hypothetical protein